MNIKKVFKISVFLTITAFIFTAQAESFRVHKTHILAVSDVEYKGAENQEELKTTVSAGINDAVCILLPEDLTYIQGIEVTIKIPAVLSKYPNSIIYSLYNNISPVPQDTTIDYTGKELYTALYPAKISQTLLIPLVQGNNIKQTPYADKTFIPDISRKFVFLRNQLAVKGMPREAMDSKYLVSAKPVYLNKGKFTLTTIPSKPANLIVTIDDKVTELDKNNSCFLKPGTHNVTITADGYRNENWSIMIETARESALNLELQSVAPTMQINMPQGTKVSVDNQNVEIKGSILELTPGEHILKFTLGGFEVVKQVTIQEGRSYSLHVFYFFFAFFVLSFCFFQICVFIFYFI